MSIKSLREQKGVTQQTIADALGVSVSAVSQWENGTATPRTNRLVELASILDCQIEDILLDGKKEA